MKNRNHIYSKKYCRVCKNTKLNPILSLGLSPLANSFLTEEQLKENEFFFPLKLNFCKLCGQVQLADIVHPDLLFKNYLYVSSTSPVFIKHFEEFAKNITKRFGLTSNDLTVDIGSNDGILLKPFQNLGVKVLGIDPAENVAEIARNNGIETIVEYFNQKVALRIKRQFGLAKVITGNNVFAHVDNSDELITGVQKLLTGDGVFIIEVPYLVEFIRKNLFDTIYHEHLSYFAVKPLTKLFKRLGLEVFDVNKVSSHGGSIRVFTQKLKGPYKISENLKFCFKEEDDLKLHLIKTYLDFAKRIRNNKKTLNNLLRDLKNKGKRIVGYGAPAKGNTLLNYFKIDEKILDYIVDDSPIKQGLYTPGTHIPVVSIERLQKDNPDYIFILAWNFAEPIIDKLTWYKKTGGRFIIPVPEPKVV